MLLLAGPNEPLGGVRSLLAFWAGGAAAAPAPPTTGGYRSMLGVWIGGATTVISAPPPPSPAPAPSTAAGRRRRQRYIARWRGEDYEFATLDGLEQFVADAQASEQRKPRRLRKPIRVRLAPEALAELAPPAPLRQRLEAGIIVRSLDQVRQLERHIEQSRRRAEDDDDEVLLWLM